MRANGAGTEEKTREELAKMGLEHSSYWDVCEVHGEARRNCYCADCKAR